MSPVEMGRSGHGPAACAGFAGAAGSGTVSGAAGGRRFRRCGGFDPGRRFGNPRRGGGLLRRRIGNDPDRAARPVPGVFDGFARSFGSRHELFQLGGQRFQRRADLVGGLAGFVRQLFHFGGDDGESFAGIARARRFDRGIQRQQIGLFRDCLDLVGHACDRLDVLFEVERPGFEVVYRFEGVVEAVVAVGWRRVCITHDRDLC
jgi:hypothetical protein